MVRIYAVVWATAKYGSLNSATDWLVIRYYLNLSGYKFMEYNNWMNIPGITALRLAMRFCME